MSDTPAPARRLWYRFSLLNLLLLMAVVFQGLVIWQLAPLRDENRRLRAEVGELSIDDDEMLYIVEIPTPETHEWMWRVYVPHGDYCFCSANRSASPGVPAPEHVFSVGSLARGEVVVRARVSLEDRTVHLNVAGESFWIATLKTDGLDLLSNSFNSTELAIDIAGEFGQEKHPPDSNVFLLRELGLFDDNPGFTLWIGPDDVRLPTLPNP